MALAIIIGSCYANRCSLKSATYFFKGQAGTVALFVSYITIAASLSDTSTTHRPEVTNEQISFVHITTFIFKGERG